MRISLVALVVPGGASVLRGAIRVAFRGALVMGLTAGVGMLFGTVV